MTNRIKALRRLLARENLGGIVISDLANIRYLCGFSGSNGMMLVTRKSAWFYTDFRYKEQMAREVRGCRRQVRKRDLYANFPKENLDGAKRLGVEKDFLTIGRLELLRKQLKGVRLAPVRNLVSELRRTKDPAEVRLIRRAQAVTDAVFRGILKLVRPGVTERALAAEIEYRFKQRGESAFRPIVASGPNAALPHADPTNRRLRSGDVITFDLGCRLQGYCSDMTRTVFLDRPNPDLRAVYGIVLEAQRRAMAAIRAGAACAEVDTSARDYIKDQGYGPCFGHGLGHGVGLAVHEQPGLSPASKDRLAAGDIVTVEPGIYLPGLGGVRIEDMVLVTKTGHVNLTRSPKQSVVL